MCVSRLTAFRDRFASLTCHFALLLQLICLTSGAALAESRAVSVAVDATFPPLVFRDASGELQGLTRELWAMWSKKTGIPVEFKIRDFPQGKQAVLDGELDVIDLITISDERKKNWTSPLPTFRWMSPFIFTRPSAALLMPRAAGAF